MCPWEKTCRGGLVTPAMRIRFSTFPIESRPFSSVNRRNHLPRIAAYLTRPLGQESAKNVQPRQDRHHAAAWYRSTAPCGLSVYRRTPTMQHAIFEHFEFHPGKKICWFPSGRYPTEDSSDEKDGSLDGGNPGASERRIDLFLCRRWGSDPYVLARTLRWKVSCK